MDNSNTLADIVRFGAFEVDLRSGELRKGGLKIRLQDQPFKVLTMLLERPGHLVTREEMQKRLWASDTFVDFDQGLGTAIRKLRDALGDSADNPRFIETLPRRGFRFISPVNSHGGGAGEQPGAQLQQSEGAPSARRRLARVAVLIVTAAVLSAAFLAYLLRPPLPAPKVLRIVQLTNDGRRKSQTIFADGSRIYFTETVKNHIAVPSMISASGGEVVPIPVVSMDGEPILDISPDGSELLLITASLIWPGSEGALWTLPAVGGVPRRLGNLIAHEATWSPDGRKILYTRIKDHNLYIANADGAASHVLTTVPGQPYDIRWSPDGRLIAFTVEDARARTLWRVSADGTNLNPALPLGEFARASSSPLPAVYPSAGPRVRENQFPETVSSGGWTPDGKYFLFEWARGGPHNIWAIREGGDFLHKQSPKPMQLTSGPLSIGSPVVSKDGKRIYVLSEVQGPQLRRYDSKSGEWKPYLSGMSAEHVDISKDGRWAVYISYPGAILFKSRLDGSDKVQLTDSPVQAAMPRISPDGKEVAYMARMPGKHWRIWLTSFAGGDAQQLTSGDFNEREPSWSPDGSHLLFCSSSTSKSPSESPIVVTFDLKSKTITQVPADGERNYPRWSPDGHFIAATADNFHKVALFDLRTRKWDVLVKTIEKEPVLFNLSWSHDGQSIYFIDWSPKAPGYYRVRVQDHKIERVVDLENDVPIIKGTIGGWFGLTPDDSLLALLNEEFGEIYALDWEAQ